MNNQSNIPFSPTHSFIPSPFMNMYLRFRIKLVGEKYATSTCQCQLMYPLLNSFKKLTDLVILHARDVIQLLDTISLDQNHVIHVLGQTIMHITIYLGINPVQLC